MAQLAIKGHATRGREVIELLEMLGGENINRMSGDMDEYVYIINHSCEGEIDCFNAVSNIYEVFSLDEFYEKFPYKVGDKVRLDKWPCTITGMYWNGNSVIYYVKGADFSKGVYATDLQPHEENRLTANESISLTIDTSPMEKRQIIFSTDSPNETELVLGNNFEIKVEDGKTYVVRKKPQYPKTYEECCEVLNITALDLEILDVRNDRSETVYSKNLDRLLNSFRKLLICRDAYWKIAGEQMGLGKPWVPDWKSSDLKYVIKTMGDEICKPTECTINCFLAFPTEEMRDAFYKYFKDLIERCKKLL